MKSLNPTLSQMIERELQERFSRRSDKNQCFTAWKIQNAQTIAYVESKYESPEAYYKSVSYSQGKKTTI